MKQNWLARPDILRLVLLAGAMLYLGADAGEVAPAGIDEIIR